ncbi:AMP-binding protein [Granulicoccus phenolivorans]|uniref:AMP-binding protein n=1 Tax=Granulicoccus phenolivorans TaxID=266854 RepID=UPI0004015896|nr:AMP-binding protein [Granulicoccus phenolivorans]
MTNIAVWLAERATKTPDLIAIKQGEVTLTYAVLNQAAARFATRLTELGVGAGDRVSIIMPNVAYFPIVYNAIERLGAVVVPLNPLLKAGEIEYAWRDAEVKVGVVFASFAEEATKAGAATGTQVVPVVPGEFDQLLMALAPTLDVVDRAGSDECVIFYTSGTTGRPKGAVLTHDNIRTNVTTTRETLFSIEAGDVIFGGLPLFHCFGQTCAMNTAISGGATLDLLPRFDPVEALRMIAEDGITIFMGVPSMFVAVLQVPEHAQTDASKLRLAVSGGSSLPVEVLHGFERDLGVTVLEGYGLSETSPVASFNRAEQAKPGSIGTPIRGVEFCLQNADGNTITDVDTIGEICIRGENVMKEYLNNPDATAEAMRGGWFHTGDLAVVDSDGFYFIKDRKKDMILRNGYNVYPREVEEILYTHPAVAEAAVVAVPNESVGEEVGALVTLREGTQATEQEIIDFVKERIASYKYPRIVRFGALPKGPTGKILKRSITL